ncbi:ABC1 family-domain-containing protein [Hyaloraphidium curvatum]|nr:ABC1 family-domain-containing protein [Hyaloraphidium curvatum]
MAPDAPDPPPEVFVHPYSLKPWWWRFLFSVRRSLYLAWVFFPVGVRLFFSSLFPKSEYFREALVESFLRAMEKGGCCFMKLGQWISMRPDLFPPDIIAAMATLRTGVPPHPIEHTRREIRDSFGRDLEDIFESFEEKPSSSGTVAQVHRAVLRNEKIGGTEQVAVKVRHPNAIAESFVDLDLIFLFVDTFLPTTYALPCSQDELARIIQQQLDFRWEAYNLSVFARNFHAELSSGLIHFPRVTKSLVSDSVLVESWAEGDTIETMFSEIHSYDGSWANARNRTLGDRFSAAAREKKKQLARLLFDINAKMFLRDNMAHSDMHGGNLIFSPVHGQVTVIDAGLVATLDPDAYNAFGDFMRGLCAGNVDTITEKLLEFNVSSSPVDEGEFRASVQRLVDQWKASATSTARDETGARKPSTQPGVAEEFEEGSSPALGDLVGSLLINLQKFRMKLRGDVAASIMTISIAEGLILQLDPDFDVVFSALPYFVKYRVGFSRGVRL